MQSMRRMEQQPLRPHDGPIRLLRQAVLTTVAVIGLAAPGAAQDMPWLRQLEEQVQRQAEAIARMFEDEFGRVQTRGTRRDQRGDSELTEPFSSTVRIGSSGTFDLQNVSGDIVVTGGGGDSVRIEAIRRVRAGSDGEARAMLKQLQVRVTERAGGVQVRTAYPGRRGSSEVDYTVTVPGETNVVLRTVSGDVRVSNLQGELRVESVSGDLRATGVQQVREMKTFSGNLEVSDAQGNELEGASVSGDVVVRDLRVRTLDLTSVSGDVRISNVESEDVKVKSVSGDIDYAGELMRNGRYEITSHSGDVRVTPAGDTGFDIEANTFSGTVRSDYAISLREGVALGFAGGRSRGLRGTFGRAGAALVLQSFSGDITILRR